jgi:ppGpp synthetase/RelA/SpoT-type nucleotidyltranferase
VFREYAATLKSLITDILAHEDISLHSVTSRIKSRDSVEQKLGRPGAKYQRLADITDIAGVRIICHFAPDVDRIGQLIESEFAIDVGNTTDKRLLLDPDRFGYLSLHHVVSLGSARESLREYRRFVSLKAEVQTRSMLQHAWAEVEHDLGYKSRLAVPDHVRRRFARIAGLLELADQEFAEIRGSISAYRRSLPDRLAHAPEAVTIDNISINAFLRKDPLVAAVDAQIAERRGMSVYDDGEPSRPFVAERLRLSGLQTIADIALALRTYRDDVIALATEWLRQSGATGALTRGISLFYLAYVVVLRADDEERLRTFMATARIQDATDALLQAWRDRGA